MAKLVFILGCIVVGIFGATAPPSQVEVEFLKSRIVGGSQAPEGGFPYQVSIRGADGKHICGGCIIGITTILTAAHCVHKQSASAISIVVGSNQLNLGGTRHGVSTLRPHERYNSRTLKNDIAILKLSSSISFTGVVQPMALETAYVGADINALLSGWGFTTYPGSHPNDLQYIVLKTIGVSDCNRRVGRVDDSQICTFTKTGEGACHGDSGSPLVANGYVMGIMSWGRPCGMGYPDVYARVSHYIDWINKNSQ